MRYIKKLAILSVALALTSTAMAATGTTTAPTWTNTAASASLEVKGAPVLVAKTNNSVTLEWTKVDAATSYIVKYSTKSVATSTEANPQYDNETDPVTSTGTIVANLTPNTDYYFSVVAVDKDNNESDTFSDELQVKTDATAPVTTSAPAWSGTATPVTTWTFAIKTVTAVDNKTVELEFSSALGTTPVTVKITKTSDNSDVPVASVTPDIANPAKATAKILTVLDPSSTYSLTIVTASDTAGNTIKQGVDGIKEFPTLANLPASPDTTGLNAWGSTGATMSGATATPNLEAAKTGPQQNLIITIALLLSFAVVYAYRKKFAK